jgi:hypothetical protein
MKEFSNGNRYVVEYLATVLDIGPPISFISDVSTSHSNDIFTGSDTVSGFPADIDVHDGRVYSYNANTGFEDGLSVEASVFGSVTMKVGDTLLSLSTFFAATQQPLTAVPTDFAAASWATWGTYVDPTTLVTNFDKWIDYIRVLKIN